MDDIKIILKPIGIIHTPFKEIKDIPIQGSFSEHHGEVEIFPEYVDGLKDVEGFSHLYFIYNFHKSDVVKLQGKPYLDDIIHGIFAIRAPHRPNHIGLTIVKLLSIDKNHLNIAGVDMLDGTPLIDIKPYNPYFDAPADTKIGWMGKCFKNGKIQRSVTVRDEKHWLNE
ncbi:MAG: tRNA (N6-threonylcarbamoyladenosine(37)-N6)-methyltransferase TrmO [Spirochaetes bacterium]|jgi:tRNA-Thr(GGU) m(6)t(6)A37 methyltransferase TsaA|nr:tRNA (N6-threonylcarbamoyladenosine(37)-N6)-methyltransferase TrmO [Spirochaetota bacterium]